LLTSPERRVLKLSLNAATFTAGLQPAGPQPQPASAHISPITPVIIRSRVNAFLFMSNPAKMKKEGYSKLIKIPVSLLYQQLGSVTQIYFKQK